MEKAKARASTREPSLVEKETEVETQLDTHHKFTSSDSNYQEASDPLYEILGLPHSSACVHMDKACADLLDIGAALHWLQPGQKRPIADGWSTAPRASGADLERQYVQGANIGIRLGEWSLTPAGYLHLLDVDIRKPEAEAEAWEAVRRLVPTVDELPTVISGSGSGRHFYFWSETPLRSAKLAKSNDRLIDGRWTWEIDLFGTGKQAVLPPSIHPDTGQYYRWQRPIDFAMVSLGFGPTLHFDQGPFPEVETDATEPNWPRIRSALEAITDASDYDTWVKVGMSLHSAAGGSAAAFAMWCDWAKQDERFNERQSRKKWQSFKGKGTGIGTLFHIANQHGWTPPVPVFGPDDFDDLPALLEKPKVKALRANNGDFSTHCQMQFWFWKR